MQEACYRELRKREIGRKTKARATDIKRDKKKSRIGIGRKGTCQERELGKRKSQESEDKMWRAVHKKGRGPCQVQKGMMRIC